MKISYTYRGEKTELCNEFKRPQIANNGSVAINQNNWTDGNQKLYRVEIEAHELLEVAMDCLRQLSGIAGADYQIFASVNGNNYQKVGG
jgi:hypothetical protein